MSDQLVFTTVPSVAADRLRAEVLKDLQASPPRVFILTNYWYGEPQTFRKLDAWPEFAQYLSSHCTLLQESTFAGSSQAEDPVAYRIMSVAD